MVERAKYQARYDESGSSGSAVRLVERAGREGVVLDLGCGYGHVSEPIRDLGLTYVGLDIDREALTDLEQRGFEVGTLDLQVSAPELAARLDDAVGERPLAVVLILDVLEHLVDPAACVEALALLAARRPGTELVVSLPNITHVEIAGKLLLGRWDLLDIGLLDRTHLQLFDGRRAVSLLTDAGWHGVDADDVTALITEQHTLPDAPQLRRGAPLREVLEAVRRRADEHGHTYQFVRRYQLDPAGGALVEPSSPAAGPLIALVLDGPAAGDAALLQSIRLQEDRDLTVLVPDTSAALEEQVGAPVVTWDDDPIDALRAVGARFVVVVSEGTVLSPGYTREVRRIAEASPGNVATVACAAERMEGPRLEVAPFELVGVSPAGVVIPAAYALPASAVVDAGLGALGPSQADLATTIARCVMWCGRADSDEIALAASPTSGFELDEVLAEVLARLDAEPMIHGRGGLGATVAGARELALARTALADLRVRYEALARARDSEVAELHARIARVSTPWGALSFAVARGAAAIVRRIRRTAPPEDRS